jgi:hypothetical protein
LIQPQNRFAILIADLRTSLKLASAQLHFSTQLKFNAHAALAPLGKTTLAKSPKHRHATSESHDNARRLWNCIVVLNREDLTVQIRRIQANQASARCKVVLAGLEGQAVDS